LHAIQKGIGSRARLRVTMPLERAAILGKPEMEIPFGIAKFAGPCGASEVICRLYDRCKQRFTF
jgi:hypothetical protein